MGWGIKMGGWDSQRPFEWDSGTSFNHAINQGTTQLANEERTRVFREAAKVDSKTRSEIFSILESGNPFEAGKLLSAARKGTGVYAVRKINEEQKKLMNMAPGRSQLSPRYSIIS